MNKMFLLFLFIVFCFVVRPAAFGQTALSKGSYSLAGSIQYTSSSLSDSYSSSNVGTLSITPQFTYFVANHFSLGGFVEYYNSTPNISYGSFGPVLRYYFYVKDVNPFLEGSFNILIGSDFTNVGFGLKAGIEYFLSESVAVEPSIAYDYSTNSLSTDINYPTTTTTITFGMGINYFIF